MTTGTERRRGRPPEAEREQRRQEALEAALAEIAERGYEAVSMLDVARRAQSSKQSLYAWFGDKEGMVRAVILDQSRRTNEAVRRALGSSTDARQGLTAVANGLLDLLLGPTSIALNRAAMSSPALADVLLQSGRHTTGPLVEAYLDRLHHDGLITADDPAEAFRLLYGLVVQDSQIRVLLGEKPPTAKARRSQATAAVTAFLTLHPADQARRSR